MTYDQAEFDVRCEWGAQGLKQLGTISDVIVIADVLSFTTAVDLATARGGMIFPYPLKNESAAEYAGSMNAKLAANRGARFSLSPASLRNLPAGYRLVLPSPNGAALSFGTDHPIVLAACLRNATACARAAAGLGSTVAVIPAGEEWPTGELHPCVEDLVGARALIAALFEERAKRSAPRNVPDLSGARGAPFALPGSRSPEAVLAVAAFDGFRKDLTQALRQSASGKKLSERRFGLDIDVASDLNVSRNVPRLVDRVFVAQD